ncbi:MAG: outer membrane protein assembly factor BamD [Acidobacteria bacterium]|nr:outer membrane protein assembly factor BamD [Acidobacteriota bacterium]
MTERSFNGRWRLVALVALAVAVASCGPRQTILSPNSDQPDLFLWEHGLEALEMRRWLDARTYFQQIVDGYPQSQYRPNAKLGIGDSFMGEDSTESYLLAANEFSEFLTLYPTHQRADHAQYQLAMTHFEQMRAPERDQTETAAALAEFDLFFTNYPDSPLTDEARADWRIARDRLSEDSYRIGLHYFRIQWYPGAIDRFREVLRDDPEFTYRDQVYYYLAESLSRTDKTAEAIPYFERLLTEFDSSDRLEDARERLAELKVQ